MPAGARILAVSLDFFPENLLAAWKYRGRVPGHVYLMMQTRLVDTKKGHDLVGAFKDYCPTCWQRMGFKKTTILISRD